MGEHAVRPALGRTLSETRSPDGGRRSGWQSARSRSSRLCLIKIGLAVGLVRAARQRHVRASRRRHPTAGRTFVGELLSIFLTLNVLLCAFNLIPLPPLDGASVIGLFVPESVASPIPRTQSHADVPDAGTADRLAGIFPFIVGPLFALILKAVHPSLGYS